MRRLFILSLYLVASHSLALGAPVEDLNPNIAAPAPQTMGNNSALIDLHYEIQALREEVRSLLGIVEEQSHDLRELRQRQMDDYQDLDRRISNRGELPLPVVKPYTPPSANVTGLSAGAIFTPIEQQKSEEAAEKQLYTATLNLLRARQYDDAVSGFTQLVAKYPHGKYTANTHYWLGEIHLVRNNLPEAEKAFGIVATQFSSHAKANHANFKLGKVYHLSGKKEEARILLEKVASSETNVAPLARSYLNDNFANQPQ